MADEPEPAAAPVVSSSEATVVPSAVARILAAAVVSTIMAAAVTKVFGKKAGFVAFVVAGSAHEMFDAPLARRLSNLGL